MQYPKPDPNPRVYQVGGFPATLVSTIYGDALKALRVFGLIAMGGGVILLLMHFAAEPAIRTLSLGESESGMGLRYERLPDAKWAAWSGWALFYSKQAAYSDSNAKTRK